MVFLCIASIVLSSIALHGILLHRIALHCIALHCIALYCIAFDYLLWYCMVLHRLHGVVRLIWRAGELPRSASSHFAEEGFTIGPVSIQAGCRKDVNKI